VTNLTLGVLWGGPELRSQKVNSVLTEVLSAVSKAGRTAGDGPGEGTESTLNVVFHVPGSIFQPEFRGIRTGTFSKAKATLMVQVAVPSGLQSEKEMRSFACRSIREVIDIAAPVFSKAKIPVPENQAKELIDKMEHQMRTVDPSALDDANYYWAVIIEDMNQSVLP
jgi:hypothetical protein